MERPVPGLASDAIRSQALAWLALLRGEPSDEQAAAFEAWYAADPRHADVYDGLLESWDATALLGQAPVRPAVSQSPRYRRWAAIAAAVVLMVAGAHYLAVLVGGEPSTASPILATPLGEIRAFALADGSRVTLDTDSAVKVRFDGGQRGIELRQGRARFLVARDPTRPFTVLARSTRIQAEATTFDVELRATGVVVVLLQGSVGISRAAATGAPATQISLRAGERLILDDRSARQPRVVTRASDTRWPSGMLSFDDEAVGDVVATVNRYNRRQVVINDPMLRARRFTGTVRADAPDRLAALIAAMVGGRVESDAAGNFVIRRAK